MQHWFPSCILSRIFSKVATSKHLPHRFSSSWEKVVELPSGYFTDLHILEKRELSTKIFKQSKDPSNANEKLAKGSTTGWENFTEILGQKLVLHSSNNYSARRLKIQSSLLSTNTVDLSKKSLCRHQLFPPFPPVFTHKTTFPYLRARWIHFSGFLGHYLPG